jgi:hypothetical protein
MAEAKLKFLLDLEDRTSAGIQKVQTSLDNFKGSVEKMEPTFKKMAITGAAGFAAITGAVGLSVKAAAEAETQQARLAQIMRTTNDASDEQIQVLLDQADALERVGVVSGDAINAAQGTLATFDLQAESIKNLIPSFLNMVVAEKGVNATTDDMIGLANGLGKVLQGQVGALSKQGFVFDEATEAILKNGTEQEKVAALAEILDSTYEGLNETMRKTTEGSVKGATMAFNKLQEEVGMVFLPVVIKLTEAITPLLNKMIDWVSANPKLTATIIAVSAGLFGLVAVAGTIGLIVLGIAALIAGFGVLTTVVGALATAFFFLLSPVGLIVLGIAALIAVGVLLYQNWETVVAFAGTAWNAIVETVTGAMTRLGEILTIAWDGVKSAFWTGVNFIVGAVAMLLDFLLPGWDGALVTMWTRAVEIWNTISAFFKEVFSVIGSGISASLTVISETWSVMWEGMKTVFESIWNSIASIFDSVVSGISSAMESLTKPIQKVIDLAQRALELAGGAVKSGSGKISSLVSSILDRGSSITGKAIGGPVLAGTPYMVGENGPELFMPGQSGSIAPTGRFGGSTINLYVTGNTLLDRDAARKIGGDMVKYLKDNMRI